MFSLPELIDLAARGLLLACAGLLWVVVLVRFTGLRSFSKMTAFDFVATVAMGSLLAAAAMSTSWSSFGQTLVAMAALLGIQAALAALRRKSPLIADLLGNTPVLLMEDGEFCEKALSHTRVAKEDVWAKIRAANALDLQDVRAVVLENTGDLSVLHGGSIDRKLLSGVRRLDD